MIPKKPGPPIPPRPTVPIGIDLKGNSHSTPDGRTIIFNSNSMTDQQTVRFIKINSDGPKNNRNEPMINRLNTNLNVNTGNLVIAKDKVVQKQRIPEPKPRTIYPSSSTDKQLNSQHSQHEYQHGEQQQQQQQQYSSSASIQLNRREITNQSHEQHTVGNQMNRMESVKNNPVEANNFNVGVRINLNDNKMVSSQSKFIKMVEVNTTSNTMMVNNEIKKSNNFNSVAERLFNEISLNVQHKIDVASSECNSVTGSSPIENDTTRINLLHRPEPEGDEQRYVENPKLVEKKFSEEKKVVFHEMLISELAAMRTDDKPNSLVTKSRSRNSSNCSIDSSSTATTNNQRSRIRRSDWIELGDNGKELIMSSCHISLEDSGMEDEERLDDTSSGVGDSWDSVKELSERMSLPGLPPLPKSLSGFEGAQNKQNNLFYQSLGSEQQNNRYGGSSMTKKPSSLDNQLAVLRREMFSLRQLDQSLLSQLWTLNESIQEFRTMLQEQETLSPPSPSPTPSDTNSLSSSDEADEQQQMQNNGQIHNRNSYQRMRTAPPPPPPNRKPPVNSKNG